MQALDALRDAHLSGVLQAMTTLRAEIVAALAAFAPRREQRRLVQETEPLRRTDSSGLT